ncbi:MAG: phosphatase PAP2 family protein [Bacteroidales bacterium]|nr:phosphatase PAP2 family protein [Bacteroidales bacterium]
MRALASILLLLLFAAQPLMAQRDTAARHSMLPIGIGAASVASGAAFTFQPGMNSLQRSLRDAIQADGHQHLSFDNELQLLPLALPPALKLCGLESRHSLARIALLETASFLLGSTFVQAAKYGLHVHRPEGVGVNSFPSGHTFIAFTGAEVLRREFGQSHPWLAAAGYAVAAMVGAMRVYNNRHWLGDVMAGAGVALICVGATYWIGD